MWRNQGVTLIELMMVVVLMGVLASLGAVAYRKNQVTTRIANLISSLDGLKSAVSGAVQLNPSLLTSPPTPASLGFNFPAASFSSVTINADKTTGGVEIAAVVNTATAGLTVPLTLTLALCSPSSTTDRFENQNFRWGCFSTISDPSYLPPSCRQSTSDISGFCSAS